MAKERDFAVYTALYDSVNSARTDLEAIEQLHRDDLIGVFDAAVVDKRNGKPHIVKRIDRPMVRVIPEELGFGPLSRKELKEVGSGLDSSEAALVVLGEPTLDKAFAKAVTNANKTLKSVLDATADEVASELKEAAKG